MSKILQERFDTHAVILDTNILFHEDKSHVVDPKFDKFWSDYATDANLELFIPSVVEGELLFQQTSSALITLERANKSFDKLTDFTGKKFGHAVTDKRVKNEIIRRFKAWLKGKNAKIIDTPIKDIDWPRLIEDSIWRKPPFSPISEKDKSEKGFRDSLILESVVTYCEKEIAKQIVFITNDNLLRESAERRLKKGPTFITYPTIEEFESKLKLQKEHFEESFVNSVVEKASKKFFTFSDKNTLVYRTKLSEKLVKDYKDLFTNPGALIEKENESEFFNGGQWEKADQGWFKVVGKPQFLHIENKHTFFWNSVVSYIQKFKSMHPQKDADIYELKLIFMIKWKSNISLNSRFTKIELIDTESVSAKFYEILANQPLQQTR